jgi:dihydroorotase-like cyclic amidohydrolase
MGFDTIISGGTVVTATDTYVADVAIADGKIVAIGKDIPRENARRVLDASGKYVMPGGIDVHTHLDMPFGGTTSADDFESGTRAAFMLLTRGWPRPRARRFPITPSTASSPILPTHNCKR